MGMTLAIRTRQNLPVADGVVDWCMRTPEAMDGYAAGLLTPPNVVAIKPCWRNKCGGSCLRHKLAVARGYNELPESSEIEACPQFRLSDLWILKPI